MLKGSLLNSNGSSMTLQKTLDIKQLCIFVLLMLLRCFFSVMLNKKYIGDVLLLMCFYCTLKGTTACRAEDTYLTCRLPRMYSWRVMTACLTRRYPRLWLQPRTCFWIVMQAVRRRSKRSFSRYATWPARKKILVRPNLYWLESCWELKHVKHIHTFFFNSI